MAQSRTASPKPAAADALLDQRLFSLRSEDHEAFVQTLDVPPAPGPKLRALLRRVPTWET
ncbi:DUF1778 domain-containing protein [Novispirillum sp. DQ9]|uniref:type II toxin-antitoxin system TacA family antitoxin n=1 Tax=Novispirillum sp. DQ9 TaxID=3398612 RepID=UPI003C7B0ABB